MAGVQEFSENGHGIDMRSGKSPGMSEKSYWGEFGRGIYLRYERNFTNLMKVLPPVCTPSIMAFQRQFVIATLRIHIRQLFFNQTRLKY